MSISLNPHFNIIPLRLGLHFLCNSVRHPRPSDACPMSHICHPHWCTCPLAHLNEMLCCAFFVFCNATFIKKINSTTPRSPWSAVRLIHVKCLAVVKFKCSLPCSQKFYIGLCLEQAESSPIFTLIFRRTHFIYLVIYLFADCVSDYITTWNDDYNN